MTNFTLRLMIIGSESGRLIGQNGDNIKSIRRVSSVPIHISKRGHSDRIVTIKGPIVGLMCAVELIAESIEPDSGSLSNKRIRILLNDKDCHNLVKSGGLLLNQIVKQTGVKLRIEPLCQPGSLERLVEIQEDKGSIIEGLKHIMEKLNEQKVPHTPADEQYNP